MNTKLSAVLLCVIVVMVFAPSCKSKKTGTGEAYNLRMRLSKGDTFGQDMDMSTKMSFNVSGQKMDMDMAIKGTTSFEVTDTAGGMKELAMTYRKMDMNIEMKGADGKVRQMGNNEVNRKIVGKTVKMRINNNNEIAGIEGADDVMSGDSTYDEATRAQIKKMFSKEQMNSLFGMTFQMYPGKPVRVGDTWQKQSEVTVAGINMKMFAEYELTDVKNGVAYVGVNGKYMGKGSMKQGNVEVEMDMSGGQKGSINIGLSDGYLKGSELNMDIHADMMTRGRKIPVTVTGYYLVKGY